MEPAFRCGTRKAIEELAKELNLPFEDWMQDWPYEVIKPGDIEKYIDHYQLITDEDKKFVLMEGIIQATEDQPTGELFIKYWHKIKPALERDFATHEYTIHYWACFDNKDGDDYWNISVLMRQLWAEKKKDKGL
jgi:hypothetical protein